MESIEIMILSIVLILIFHTSFSAIHFRRIYNYLSLVSKIQERQSDKYDEISESLSAFGARWGLQTEASFRNGIRGILEEKGYTVEMFREENEKGVFIEIDAVINSNDEHPYLVEIKSAIDQRDIIRFDGYSKFFTEKTGKIPARKSIISPYVYERAYDAAKKYGVEIFTHSGSYK
jgi:hypothetical protein